MSFTRREMASHAAQSSLASAAIAAAALVVVAALVVTTSPASAAPLLKLSRTGQSSCYDAAGAKVSCAGTGQDGALAAGVAWPTPRFANNGDGTLTDKLSGLVWLADANCIKTHYASFDQDAHEGDPSGLGDGSVTWARCLAFIAGLDSGSYPSCAAGKSDWRMANVNELETLTNVEATGLSWLQAQGFSNLVSDGYWSSTTHRMFLPDNGWFVDLYAGAVTNTDKTDVGGCLPVRGGQVDGNVDARYPANVFKTGQSNSYAAGDDGDKRAGVSWPSPRLLDNGDGTVTDQLTGLMWLADANCMASHYSASDSDGRVSWREALDFVAGINNGTYSSCAAGRSDWRLPNRRELHSLTDHSTTSGDTLPSAHPFVNVYLGSSSGYWSSTTYVSRTSWAWYWNPKLGDISGTPKSGDRAVWPVRGGVAVTPSEDPNIAVSPSPLDFGDVTVGTASVVRALTISNTGGSKLTVQYVAQSSPAIFELSSDKTVNACGATSFSLQPAESCTLGLQFRPNAVRAFAETLTIHSDDPDSGALAVDLAGSGIAYPAGAPRIHINPSSHDFGELPINQRSAAQIFTLGNDGESSLTVSLFNAQVAEEFDVDLEAGDSPCGALPITVGVNAYCTFAVVFAPKQVGQREGLIYVHSNDPIVSSAPLTLRGTATPDQSSGGCGCAANGERHGELGGAALLLGLGLLVLLSRRRRKG